MWVDQPITTACWMNICVVKSTNGYGVWFHVTCRSTEKLPTLLSAKGNGSLVCCHSKRGDAGPSVLLLTLLFGSTISYTCQRTSCIIHKIVRTKRNQRSKKPTFFLCLSDPWSSMPRNNNANGDSMHSYHRESKNRGKGYGAPPLPTSTIRGEW